MSKWTLFWDMHSGGGLKVPPLHYIFIEAPETEAEHIFYRLFERDPYEVTCSCCGEDYSVSESDTLEEATEYHRQQFGRRHQTMKEFEARDDVAILRAPEYRARRARAEEERP